MKMIQLLTATIILGACGLAAQQPFLNVDTSYLGTRKGIVELGATRAPVPPQFKLPLAEFIADGQDLVSTNSHFDVRIGPSLAAPNSIVVKTPGQEILHAQPTGLSYFDAATGTNALIAEIKAGHTRLVSSNRVVFVDCWDDVKADVSLVLDRYGFAQNIELRSPLPDPAAFGLNPKTTRLQVWTEVREAPEPKVQEGVLKEILPGLLWKDETLVFSNQCQMNPGKAFLVGGLTNAAGQTKVLIPDNPVGKQWRKFGDRTFLIEEIEYLPLAPELQKLPPAKKEGAFISKPLPTHRVASAQSQLPALPVATAQFHSPKSVQVGLAGVIPAIGTLVIDYELTYYGRADVDADGLPDEWEIVFFGSITNYNASHDPDSDGQLNLYELLNGTSPMNSDTDGDGLLDNSNDFNMVVSNGLNAVVWIDDRSSLPTNACLNGDNESWTWYTNSANGPPYAASGAHDHVSTYYAGLHQHYFTCHPNPLYVPTGSVLFAHVYIPPGRAPSELMLQWLADDETWWNHRACWGQNLIWYTPKHLMSTNIPPTGQWVYLGVRASDVDLEGRTVVGMAFALYGGMALWDYVGLHSDADGDGIPNSTEAQYGTDPNNPDSDYDGISDGQELTDGTDPTDPTDFTPRRLGYWKFDAGTFVGEQGQLPTLSISVSNAPSWSSNALATSTQYYSGVRYREYETNGSANINCLNGTVRLWFKPNWASTNQGGQGPGTYSRLFEMGRYNQPLVGHWALGLDPAGTVLWFFGNGTNSTNYAEIGVTISWPSNQWHQIALTYTATNSVLYVDGQAMNTNGGGIVLLDASLRKAGFRVGFDYNGAWSNGHFEELETFNYPLSSSTISNDYGSVDLDGDGLLNGFEIQNGFDPNVWNDPSADTDLDGLTNLQEQTHGTNPRNADTDGDGMPDGWETKYSLNPLSNADATGDSDGDGFSNIEEFRWGMDPTVSSQWYGGPEIHLDVFTPLK